MLLKSWEQLLTIRRIGGFYRTLVSEVKIEETGDQTVPKKKYAKKTTEKKRSKEILAYFDTPERNYVLNTFSETLLRKKNKVPEGLYNTSETVARTIVDHLKKDLPPERPLLEVFPGPGHVTKLLSDETTNPLVLYEPDEKFHKKLCKIISDSPNRNVILKNLDITALWKLAFIDKIDHGTRIDEALTNLVKKEYDDEPNIRMFVPTCSLPFIKHLIHSIVFQNSLIAMGRCEFFMCLPPPLYIHLTCSKEAGYMMYRPTSVLFQILFEYEFICRLNRKDFLPWQTELKTVRYAKIQKFTKLDSSSIYLVKAVPRRNLHQFIMPDHLVAFWYFVRQHFVRRKNQVIPMMERWIPNCGPRLIVNAKTPQPPQLMNPKLDVSSLPLLCQPCFELSNRDFIEDANIFTEFGDLTPSQVLTLFDQFINWPEFRECSFNASLDSAMMKFHTNPDDTTISQDLVEEVEEDEKKTPEEKF